MADRSEAVHVHKSDADPVIEAYRKKGYVLLETTDPTIIAQAGFIKLIFVPEEDYIPQPEVPHIPKKRFGLFFFF
jgi:hypothetical protein